MSAGTPVESERLRVAMVWSQTLYAEHVLDEPRPVLLGYGPDALFPLPEAHAHGGDLTLLAPRQDGGYTLSLPYDAKGAVWLSGQKQDVSTLRERGHELTLGPDDYGVVSLGAASYFFQRVAVVETAPRALGSLDLDAMISLGLSVFVHVCVLLLFMLAARELPRETSLMVRPELVSRLVVTPPTPETPPPEPTKKADESGPKKKDDGGGKREARDEGKLGKRNAPDRESTIEGREREAIARKVRGMGVLGALAGGDSMKRALEDDQVGALLGGLASARTDLGAGSSGRGLRGTGSGGGGDGPGTLLGGGALGTGIGSGRGGGKGGSGRGTGSGGSGRGEVQVQMQPGAPEVSGYLSAEQINRVVRANQAALRYCYETEVQRQRGLRGKVVLQWRVDRQGGVPSARVASSTLGNAAVEGCLVRQVKKWRFPQPDGGEVSVMYPFLFGVGG